MTLQIARMCKNSNCVVVDKSLFHQCLGKVWLDTWVARTFCCSSHQPYTSCCSISPQWGAFPGVLHWSSCVKYATVILWLQWFKVTIYYYLPTYPDICYVFVALKETGQHLLKNTRKRWFFDKVSFTGLQAFICQLLLSVTWRCVIL